MIARKHACVQAQREGWGPVEEDCWIVTFYKYLKIMKKEKPSKIPTNRYITVNKQKFENLYSTFTVLKTPPQRVLNASIPEAQWGTALQFGRSMQILGHSLNKLYRYQFWLYRKTVRVWYCCVLQMLLPSPNAKHRRCAEFLVFPPAVVLRWFHWN